MSKLTLHYPIIILLITSVFGQFIGVAFYPVLPAMYSPLHVSHHAIQFVVPCYLAGFALTQIIAGFLSDQFGRRHIFLLGLAIASLSALLCTVANNLLTLLMGFFGQAVGIGFVVPIQSAVVRDIYDEKRSVQIFGLVNIALATGGIIAPILGGFVEFFLGWRWLFGLLFFMGILLLILSFFLLSETTKKELRRPFSFAFLLDTAKKLCASPYYGGAVVASGLLTAAQAAFNTAAPFLLHSIFHFSSHSIGMLMAIPTIAMVLGLLLAGIFVKFISYRNMILIGITITFLSALIMFCLKLIGWLNVSSLIIPVAILYAGLGFATPSFWTTALCSFTNITAVAASFLIFFQNLFSIITSSFIAYASEGSAIAFIGTLLVTTALALIIYPLLNRGDRAVRNTS